ncbi:hypothetical protein Dimus_026212 [Dionaea muscipula]
MSAEPSHDDQISLYPHVPSSNPESPSPFLHPSSTPPPSLYPSIQSSDHRLPTLPQPESPPSADSSEQVLIRLPATIVHLIDPHRSVELAFGDLEIVRLIQNDAVVAVLARIGDQIQWPLAKDEAAVKLDESHYFFTLRIPSSDAAEDDAEHHPASDEICAAESILNYGVTIASKGQEGLLEEFDRILDMHSSFSVQRVEGEVRGWWAAKEAAPEELERDDGRREAAEEWSAAYWTTLAPNVEEYSGSVARMIAAGSGQLIKGILWCGDVTVDRLKWGNEFLKGRLGKKESSDVSPELMKRIKRVEKVTKMTEQFATEVLSGVVKVTGYITSSVVNSEVGKKFFSLLPGEIILAYLDAFNKVFDAVEVAGKSVMAITSVVATELVSERYGEEAAKATYVGLGAAGHALGTAWAIFKIRKAVNPKSVMNPTVLARAAAEAGSFNTKPIDSKQM